MPRERKPRIAGDINGYPSVEEPSEREPQVSDIGYPGGDSREGEPGGDITGYPGTHIRITKAEFRAREPGFQKSGFSSIEEYIEDMEFRWRVANGLDPLPGPLGGMRTLDERGSKQVGLRLPGRDYERLVELSAENGVSPATMARILVVRAVRSSVDFAEHDDE